MSAKYKSPSFLLPNELNTSANTANNTGINSLYSISQNSATRNERINIGDVNLGTTNTVSIWVYIKTNVGFADTILGLNSAGAYFWFLSSTALRVQVSAANNIANFTNNDIQSNVWQHLVVTREGTDLRLFVNGVYKQLVTIANGALDSLVSDIGGRAVYGGSMRGQIDEVSFYTSALTYGNVSIGQSVSSDSEIAKLYDSIGSSVVPSNLMATSLNPVAYYPLGEQAQNTGKLPQASANVWQFPNGVLQDYVMDFDGSTNYINAGESILPSGNFTISAWVKPASFPIPYATIFSSYENSASGRLLFRIKNDGKLELSLDSATLTSNTSLSANTWQHVMVTLNGTSLTFYLNGSSDGSGTASTPPAQNLTTYIGAWDNSGSPNGYFNGEISNLAIWNTDQSTNKDNIYNNGSPQTSYTVAPQNWWKLNADSVYTPSVPNYTTALNFDGNNDLVNANSVISSISSSTTGTVSGWIKYPSTGSTAYMITFTSNTNTSQQYLTIQKSSNEHATAQLKDRWILQTNSAVFSPGNWYHYAVTQNGTEPKLYINGTEYSSGNGATLTLYPSTDGTEWWPNLSDFNTVTIGGMIWNNGSLQTLYGNQDLSNISIFNSALTATQISTLFNFGTPETAISFDPTAWWKLNDQNAITDSSGNGNTGNNNGATNSPGGVAYAPSWKIQSALPIPTVNYTSALEFNRPTANNEYVDIGTISFLNQAGDFTISQWVNPANIVGNHNMPIQFGTLNNFIYLRNNAWQYEFRGGQRQFVPTNGVPVPEEEWIHIALTVEGTVSKFYQNGDLKHTGVVGTTYSANAVRIGNYYSLSYPWYGQISNTALFDSALIDSDIDTLYNNGQPEATPSFSPLHWWKLDNTTTGIQDSVGSSNGTLVQTSAPGAQEVATNVYIGSIPVNGVSTTLPSTALQQSDLQFDSPYSNYSLSFDGNSYIDTNFTLPASYTSFSYSFWFKRTTSANPGTEYIISNLVAPGNNNQARGLIRFGVTNLRIQGGDGTSTDYDTGNISATAILDQNWHHISVTFISGEIKTYFDGSLVNTYTNSLVVTGYAADRTYVIGQNGIGTGYLVNSKLDEFAIFNKKLTEAEILSIYNNGRPGDISPIAPTNWWRLGENAYFVNNDITLPNSVSGAPNGVSSGTATSMLTADAPGTYANGIGTNLDIIDRVGDAPLSVANSQSYNMIPDDKVPYVPGYVGAQTTNAFEMTFDGIDDFIDLGRPSSLNLMPSVDAFSISAWFKTTSSGTIYSFGAPSTPSNTQIKIVIRGASGTDDYYPEVTLKGTATTIGSSAYNDGNWHNIVLTCTTSTANLYIDGTNVGSPTIGTATITSTDNAAIGARTAPTGGFFFNGFIDEVAIFDKALTADQIKFDLYSATTTGKTADIENNTNLPTPVAWYRMGD